jgi:hypothetical protein
MTRVHAAARALAAGGWRIFPCAADKRPLVRGGFKAATTNADDIDAWWAGWPTASIGWDIPPDHLVLDIDPRHGGDESLAELEAEHGRLPKTLSSLTGGGGQHLIFKVPAGTEVLQLTGVRDGIDTRVGGRGYIILPPSMHASGRRYAWSQRVAPVEAPGWLIEMVRGRAVAWPRADGMRVAMRISKREPYAESVLAGECKEVSETTEGGRNDRLNKAWWRMQQFRHVIPLERARAELTKAALAAGLSEQEIARVLR